jgi:hypothetical protein
MDVMVDSFPKDSLALYQANWEAKQGEGDAFLFRSGGVGIFGEQGVRENWVKEKKWVRIVITLGGVWGSGTGRKLMTYVNGELCASISKGILENPDGRFAVSTQLLTLFASTKDTLAPGIKVKYVEFKPRALSQQEVKQMTYANRIYSYWDVERQKGIVKNVVLVLFF